MRQPGGSGSATLPLQYAVCAGVDNGEAERAASCHDQTAKASQHLAIPNHEHHTSSDALPLRCLASRKPFPLLPFLVDPAPYVVVVIEP